MTEYTLWLPYALPPLTANQRMHWRRKADTVRDVRYATNVLARNAKLPQGVDHATVALHYVPRDRRRRDADNLVPTLKAACDGLVDAGLTADDTPNLMTKHMPTIDPPSREAPGPRESRLYLTITTKGEPRA
ncbi:hypothetical protein [Corynebacterium freneyi]|uniref:Crossover junction endodeoxyribonuclease RusA n=1 Tax=Corynebacterium freneyi TaxID=134034 RepID=A0ABS4U8U4_9CORY|nr:hypothetical protein [Corynebacterium freneyi]MBP2333074.1 crossover junction endodeoxyribonuclease RusA [Corynebacterium freneyi]QXA52831.1 hypothetical protein I6L56_12625 [Corynebacterium freneyi]WJZ04824.1 hypothetical protein CFREN_04230 [Corynebacterium freneyi]